MAVVRPARSSPPFALIIFIFLWVVSTGLAVLFYVQWGKAGDEGEKNRLELAGLASADERRTGDYGTMMDNFRAKRPVTGSDRPLTVYGQMDAQLKLLRQQIAGASGEGKASERVIADAKAALLAAGQSGTDLATGVRALATAVAAEKAAGASLKTQLDTAQRDYAAAKQQYDDANKADKTAAEDARKQLEATNTELARVRADVKTMIDRYEADKTQLAGTLEDAQRKAAVQAKQATDDLAVRDIKIKDLEHQIELLRPTVAGNLGHDPDGVIVRTTLDANEVWINLGRKDHVSPGLTFAVYDPRFGVGSGTDARGKGGIEVVEVGDNQSLCRISHVEKGQTLLADDLIANPVYNKDKNRKFHFAVYGDFDLDGDGVTTPAEREKVIRLIQAWGGVIDEKLTSQTDFVVLGAQPGSASTKFDEVTEQTDDMKAKRKSQQDEYNKLMSDARAYAIPVLNANRFLAMVGYYSTTIVK